MHLGIHSDFKDCAKLLVYLEEICCWQVRCSAYALLCDWARPESLMEVISDVADWRMLIDIGLGALNTDGQPGQLHAPFDSLQKS